MVLKPMDAAVPTADKWQGQRARPSAFCSRRPCSAMPASAAVVVASIGAASPASTASGEMPGFVVPGCGHAPPASTRRQRSEAPKAQLAPQEWPNSTTGWPVRDATASTTAATSVNSRSAE
jgi:hypothetical protein